MQPGSSFAGADPCGERSVLFCWHAGQSGEALAETAFVHVADLGVNRHEVSGRGHSHGPAATAALSKFGTGGALVVVG